MVDIIRSKHDLHHIIRYQAQQAEDPSRKGSSDQADAPGDIVYRQLSPGDGYLCWWHNYDFISIISTFENWTVLTDQARK